MHQLQLQYQLNAASFFLNLWLANNLFFWFAASLNRTYDIISCLIYIFGGNASGTKHDVEKREMPFFSIYKALLNKIKIGLMNFLLHRHFKEMEFWIILPYQSTLAYLGVVVLNSWCSFRLTLGVGEETKSSSDWESDGGRLAILGLLGKQKTPGIRFKARTCLSNMY